MPAISRLHAVSIAFVIVCCISLTYSPLVYASMFDDTKKLKGQFIVDVGDLSKVECFYGGAYDCSTFPQSLYRLDYGKCYDINGYYGLGDQGIVAVDRTTKAISIFIISTSIRQYTATAYECPY